MEILRRIMEATLYPIPQPKPYHLFHILFMIISIALMLVFCILMRNKSDKTFRTVILVIGIFLLSAELYKHFYYALAFDKFKYDENGQQVFLTSGYEWEIVSFQLCSVPMYLAVAIGCMKKCKLRDVLCEYTVSIGFLGGIMAYLEPSGILHNDLFCLLHSCIWHGLLIFLALYILFTKNANRNLKDYYKAIIVFGGVVLVATLLNLIFYSKADEKFNMCYISPFRDTPLAVFKDITAFFRGIFGEYLGRALGNILYILVVPAGGFIIYLTSYYIRKLCILIKTKRTSN